MDLADADQPKVEVTPGEGFLTRVGALIDWAALDVDSREGVPKFALKIALLKDWYGVSDSGAQSALLDRLSFRAFLNFFGDGSASDVAILNELNYGTWARVPAMRAALIDVEEQLRKQGYAVRAGELREPSLLPCTENGIPVKPSGQTSLFDPGELGRMLEAVTAKAHADGIDPVAPVEARTSPSQTDEMIAKALALPIDVPLESPAPRAVLEWPWGARTELTERLDIGRDYAFSPLAKELTPYTHVSRKHAEMMVHGDAVWVRDLGSRNGTYVNDEEVPKGQALLIDGDAIIRFGPALAVALKIYG